MTNNLTMLNFNMNFNLCAEYIARRNNLIQQLPNASVALLPSAVRQIRNNDTAWPFRQNSNFYYLTGFVEPQALCVLIKDHDGSSKFILFNQRDSIQEALWDGKKLGQQGAIEKLGADAAYDIDQVDKLLPTFLLNKKIIYYPIAHDLEFDQKILMWLKHARANYSNYNAKDIPETLQDLLPLIYEMRLFKSDLEIQLLKQAAYISAMGHVKLMQTCKPDLMEYQLQAKFSEHCQQAGSKEMAYPSIIGGGENACTLHYIDNNKILKTGDLVLVDAGCEYNYYAADITRTFPVNGKFTEPQKQIYQLVLTAQLAGIAQVKPGITFDQIQTAILEVLVSGLVDLGLLQGDIKNLIDIKAYKKFYMHSSGHWLGLDVHDVGKYKVDGKWRKLLPGMVLTVEPGIYIAMDDNTVAAKWRGIGVRIEDDILVTANGNEVLSKDVPKSVLEIERVMLNGTI